MSDSWLVCLYSRINTNMSKAIKKIILTVCACYAVISLSFIVDSIIEGTGSVGHIITCFVLFAFASCLTILIGVMLYKRTKDSGRKYAPKICAVSLVGIIVSSILLYSFLLEKMM